MNFTLKVTRKVMENDSMMVTLEYAGTDEAVSGQMIVKLPIDTAGIFLGNEYAVSEPVEEPII